MSDTRLTIRITPKLRRVLRARARAQGQSESRIVRSLLERELAPKTRLTSKKKTPYDALLESGLIGSASGAPPDLSTNKEYMKGFGEWDVRRSQPRRSGSRKGVAHG